MEVRLLRADEVELRVQTVKENGFSLLLYKDARCDMRILDETFGIGNWQRHHEVINDNLFCNVGVRFERENGFGEWVWKQDVGTESFTEKQKGEASDSFKRACFNWGIGRELYTAPSIWINNEGDVKNYKDKLSVSTSFKVSEIDYNDSREINHLVIVDNKGKERYRLGSYKPQTTQPKAAQQQQAPPQQPTPGVVKFFCSEDGVEITERIAKYSTEKYGRALCMDCQKKAK